MPNPSFEDTVHCPTTTNQLNDCALWLNPTQGTPEYYNACSTANMNAVSVPNNIWGIQAAYSGVAYAGIYTFDRFYPNDAREYLEIQLSSALTGNHKYFVSFYVSLADNSQYAVSSIGAYFSNSQISATGFGILSYTPQVQNPQANVLADKNNWVLISDTLYAEGGEQYITIGNFKSDSLSDTLSLGFGSGGHVSYYYVDSVSVVDDGLMGIEDFANRQRISTYPNPNNGKVYVSGFIASEKAAEIEVMDMAGKTVYKEKRSIANGIVELNLPFENGVYFIHSKDTSGFTQVQRVIINK